MYSTIGNQANQKVSRAGEYTTVCSHGKHAIRVLTFVPVTVQQTQKYNTAAKHIFE